jgi:MFS family permease
MKEVTETHVGAARPDAARIEKDVTALVGEEAKPIDPEIERRVLRKIDMFLMPAMVIGYGLVYYDKVSPNMSCIYLSIETVSNRTKAILGSAALFGMTKDLQLSVVDNSTTPPRVNTSRLSWATSIFYFGQLAGSYPMTYLLQRFNARYVLGPAVMFWAVICAATAGVSDWRGLLAQRFFLGMFS